MKTNLLHSRIFALLGLFALLIALCPVAAQGAYASAEATSASNFDYEVLEEDDDSATYGAGVYIWGYSDNGFARNVVLPESIEGVPVVYADLSFGLYANTLDASGCSSLKYLSCSDLESLKLPAEKNLEYLDCYQVEIDSLDLSESEGLVSLFCAECGLTSLGVSGCSLLEELDCSYNNLSALDLSENESLLRIDCTGNELAKFELQNCKSLEWLSCGWNKLTTLNLSGLSSLWEADCSENSIESLMLSGCASLESLYCTSNNLVEINLGGLSALEALECADNKIKNLDIGPCPALSYLDCSYNSISDASKLQAWLSEEGHDGAVLPQGDGPWSIADADVDLEFSSCVYNGKVRTPFVDVSMAGEGLLEGEDYKVSYSEGRKRSGTYKVTVTGIGKYTGTVTKSFVIKDAALSSGNVTLSYSVASYSGYSKKPTATVKVNGVAQASSEYATTYWNKSKSKQATPKLVGTYYAKVTAKSAANTTGSVWKKLTVNPKATANLKLTRLNNGFKASWTKRTAQCSGYQIAYKQTGTSTWKTKAVTGCKTNVKSVTGLKDKKSYQVKVRTCKTVGGVKYYSSWTSAKTIKTK